MSVALLLTQFEYPQCVFNLAMKSMESTESMELMESVEPFKAFIHARNAETTRIHNSGWVDQVYGL